MKHETISALRIDLYECEKAPRDILRPLLPTNAVQYAWIPQTLGDQIWVMYEFETKQDRESWEASLPDKVRAWLDRGLIEHALPYGWHVRDMNGFYR